MTPLERLHQFAQQRSRLDPVRQALELVLEVEAAAREYRKTERHLVKHPGDQLFVTPEQALRRLDAALLKLEEPA